ncbi:Oxidoreductase family protein [Methanococcoides burtonii DSM 6242]|uniref:Oxidoreductase family protein n=1 Tax=Methanococcoides burtonii (strain DSM 6242 / NBRC 107633 / OCM 468 / ACE-M) TaxID=259564 RepID=Q12VL1_METBU|nr:Oxidoreductase family protein [Methanococcoides burtonii DSM 6242]
MTGIAVIGTGYWGKNHVRTYSELVAEGIIDHVKICDINEKRAQELGKAFNIEYLTDYKDILSDPDIDAVSIVTPSPTHFPLAKEFMEAGKDVLVEKPMTMDYTEAEKLTEIAKSTGQILMVGHIFRHHPAVKELKNRIDIGEFGNIRMMSSNRLSYGAPRKDMGVVYALGIHEVDMFCYLLDVEYPKNVTATTLCSLQSDIEETAMITMELGENTTAYAFESWLMPAYGKQRDLVVVGSEKAAKIDYLKPQELHIYDIRIEETDFDGKTAYSVENEGDYIIPIPYAEPLKEELKNFVHCIQTRERPLSDGFIGQRAVKMAEAVLESAKTGRKVSF